jgi:transcriptional regulator with PAS, ATPase and Fis domain
MSPNSILVLGNACEREPLTSPPANPDEEAHISSVETTDEIVARTAPPTAVLIRAGENETEQAEAARRIRDRFPSTTIVMAPRRFAGASGRLLDDALMRSVTVAMHRAVVDSAPSNEPSEHPRLLGEHRLVGESAPMRAVKRVIAQAAQSDSNVLILGETGTGKELTAALIHENGSRRRGPMVSLNCAAFPETLLESELFGFAKGAFTGATTSHRGKLELANGGTLFLDEIGELDAMGQVKLLRVIENRSFYPLGASQPVSLDVRIIAATNDDLDAAVAMKRFRRDLFYRLNVVAIELPPLRERREDVPALCSHYLNELNRRFRTAFERLSNHTSGLLQDYSWPGNVRELRNVIESAIVMAPSRRARALDLPGSVVRRMRLDTANPVSRRDEILRALGASDWNKKLAAKRLGCSRMTLYRRMSKLGIGRHSPATRDPHA